ncbi:Nardilysin [Folsomia candida]|uniref:Nardilysin n=1 Tax=Folsomia candida TaxID=158441 RepID=A0A226ELS7_FOLCA|nr:Nardilysin [Folsomia candida]
MDPTITPTNASSNFAQFGSDDEEVLAPQEMNESVNLSPGSDDCSGLGHIFKSPLDPRKYKAIELPNGLKAILISTLDVPSSNKNKTCHLQKILQFNKTCMGLDSTSFKIRCECETSGRPTFVDKASSTVEDVKIPGAENSEESVSFVEVMNAIKALILGEIEKGDDATSTMSKSTTDVESPDPEDDAQSCTAFLTVGAGWFNDPPEMPGMAHFIEHCFFLGSKKFPYPNQLFRLTLPHDGYTNAYTSGDTTVYTVSTSLEIFSLALEMLSDGVGYPLLPRDLVAKEMDALDSEFSLRQDDMPKVFQIIFVINILFLKNNDHYSLLQKYNQLLASLAKEGHPLRNMDTGNKETLRIPHFYKRMVEWRSSNYCSNYMTLGLEAPLDLVEMEELVTTYFSSIPSSILPHPRSRIKISGSPFQSKIFHRIYRVPSIYHSEFIAIHWALEPMTWKNLSVKALEYLGSLISSKGQGGLYQFLSYFGLCTNVTAGCWDSNTFSNQYTSIFTIYLDLTEEGFSKQDGIIGAVFAYLDMLGKNEPSLHFFQELQKQHADYFHHQSTRSSTTYCEDACLWLQNVPAKYVLVAPQLITKFDKDFIYSTTQQLKLETCNIMVFSKKYREQSSMESFYQTPYSSQEFSKELIDKIEKLKSPLSKIFHLPSPNPYLYEITCCGTQQKNLIRNGPLMIVQGKCSIFYKDEKFKNLKGQFPQAKYVFWLHSPVMNSGQKSETLMDFICHFINEMIESKFSSALVAHFHLHAKVTPGKIELSLTGPSHQLPQVTKDVFKILILFEKLLDMKTFHVGKQIYIERMDNILLDNRIHAWEVMNFLWANRYTTSKEHIKHAEKIDYFALLDFIKAFKRKMYIAGFLHGFITIEQAFYVVQTVSHFMKMYPKPVSPREIRSIRCPQLPIGENIVKIKSKNVRTHTSVVINGYQFGPLNESDDKIINFLAKCMSDASYHQLRTLEQLGYIVLVYHDDIFDVTSLFIEVVTQPKNFSTDYCNKRMDKFIQEFYNCYLTDESKFTEFMIGKPQVSFDFFRVQELYQRFLLPNEEFYRKLSVQVVQDFFCLKSFGLLPAEFCRERKRVLFSRQIKSLELCT